MSRLRGRFEGPTDPEMDRFSSSIEIDLRMASEDLAGSRAHALMLGEVGILTPAETDTLVNGLETIERELDSGLFRPSTEHEDIHMAVEARLEELVGEVAGKLHTARSRNDQVATDVRLWLKRHLVALDESLCELLESLLDRIERDGQILMPGYTHLQRGQPILLGHHCLGHAWPLSRDRERLGEAYRRLDALPLGACALAGTGHAIDRERVAELLGFPTVVENAIDAVAARDHLQEVAAVCAIIMSHCSRMAEELVLWSSAEFRFVRLDEAYATGSSIMPQKRNPDAAELIRGKASGVYGNLVTLLTLTKGLPLAYNRDLQEDRAPLFDAVETTASCARILGGIWRTVDFDDQRFETELRGDESLATELADALVASGWPFRKAHLTVSSLVLELEKRGGGWETLTPGDLEEVQIGLSWAEVEQLFDPRRAIARRDSRGGTAWTEVVRQVDMLRTELAVGAPDSRS